MSVQQSDVATQIAPVDLDPAMKRQMLRRANQLCRRAEPHTDTSPCAAHVNEAGRQLRRHGG